MSGLVAATVCLLLGACSGSDDAPDRAVAPDSDGATASSTPPARAFPAGTEDLCGAFATAYETYGEVGGLYGDRAEVPPEALTVLRRWGEDLAAAELPPDLDRDQRDGARILAATLRTAPEQGTGADLRALDRSMSLGESQLVTALVDYVDATCGLDDLPRPGF